MTDLKPILSSFKKEIKEILGKNFQDLILFASYARGEGSTESDIDLPVVLKKEKNGILADSWKYNN
jgi:predicted nucleotidyltransferase